LANHDHAIELERAGANITGRWSSLAFLARKYPLGAIGAVIMVVFLLTALLAGITGLDPFSTDARSSLAQPGGEHILGADFMGGTSSRASSSARAFR
jgi:peptide/nickel transport system permease protein